MPADLAFSMPEPLRPKGTDPVKLKQSLDLSNLEYVEEDKPVVIRLSVTDGFHFVSREILTEAKTPRKSFRGALRFLMGIPN